MFELGDEVTGVGVGGYQDIACGDGTPLRDDAFVTTLQRVNRCVADHGDTGGETTFQQTGVVLARVHGKRARLERRTVVLVRADLLSQLRGGQHPQLHPQHLVEQRRLSRHGLVVGRPIRAGEPPQVLEITPDLLGLDQMAAELEGFYCAAGELKGDRLSVVLDELAETGPQLVTEVAGVTCAATRPRRIGLEHQHLAPAPRQGQRGTETGPARTDNHHIRDRWQLAFPCDGWRCVPPVGLAGRRDIESPGSHAHERVSSFKSVRSSRRSMSSMTLLTSSSARAGAASTLNLA